MQLLNKKSLFCFLLLAAVQHVQAGPFVLVTPEEAAREQSLDLVDKSMPTGSIDGAPVIRLLSPEIGSGPVKAPVDIELAFDVGENAELDRESIRVYYGAFRVDVTERILGEAEFTEMGLLAQNADVPTGKHKLLVVVRDSLQRESSKLFKFKVK